MPERVVRRQRLLLEDVEGCAGDLATVEGGNEIVQPRGHAASDVDEAGGGLHRAEAGGVPHELRFGRVRDGGDDEVGFGQAGVELGGRDELGERVVFGARVDADHAGAEGGAEAGGFGADAADAVDQHGRFGQVEVAALAGARVPAALGLGGAPIGQAAGEREHEHHDVLGDVVGVDAARVADHHRMFRQLRVVIARRRAGEGVLEQAEALDRWEQIGSDAAVGSVGVDQFAGGGFVVFGDDDVEIGQFARHAARPGADVVVDGREEDVLGHWRTEGLTMAGGVWPPTTAATFWQASLRIA